LWGKGPIKGLSKYNWNVILVPPQLELSQRKRLCRLLNPDVCLILKTRNYKNHPLHYKNIPTIFLIDDADFLDPSETQNVIDCTSQASLVIAANQFVADWCSAYNNNVVKIWVPHNPQRLPNSTENSLRPNRILWAAANPKGYQLEQRLIVDSLLALKEKRNDFQFWVTGCDDKAWTDEFIRPLLQADIEVKTHGFIKSYKEYMRILASCPIGLHPICLDNPYSKGKSFGKILSYMVANTCVVTNDVPDHNEVLSHGENAMIAENCSDYADSLSHLLDNPSLRQNYTDQAYRDFLDNLATPVATQRMFDAIKSTFPHL
jgi:glycosyltransferase involved in cell wall biosynthesis